MLLSSPPASTGVASKVIELLTTALSAGEFRLTVGLVLSTTIEAFPVPASFSPEHGENALAVYVPSATKLAPASLPSHVAVPPAPPARVPRENSRTSAPPMPVPARILTVIPVTETVAGLFTVMTVLSLSPELLGWLGEMMDSETPVTFGGGTTVKVALADVMVLGVHPAAELVT